jgi:hypothetical protein
MSNTENKPLSMYSFHIFLWLIEFGTFWFCVANYICMAERMVVHVANTSNRYITVFELSDTLTIQSS